VVLWPEDRIVDRDWLLQNVSGASGLLMMITERVSVVRASDFDHDFLNFCQVDKELLDAGE
jgi:hypothetical protein